MTGRHASDLSLQIVRLRGGTLGAGPLESAGKPAGERTADVEDPVDRFVPYLLGNADTLNAGLESPVLQGCGAETLEDVLVGVGGVELDDRRAAGCEMTGDGAGQIGLPGPGGDRGGSPDGGGRAGR